MNGSGRWRRGRVGLPAVAVVVLLALLVALLGYGLSTSSPSDSIDERLAASRPATAPGFELDVLQRGTLPPRLQGPLGPRLEDGRLGLGELRGRPLVINFWASWCPPCRAEAGRLERAWRSARRNGVLFIGLNMQDVTDDARAFLREFDVSYPNVRDPSDEVARRWGVVALPETFFLDSRGRVVGHVIGAASTSQLTAGVRASRGGGVVGAESGGARRPTR